MHRRVVQSIAALAALSIAVLGLSGRADAADGSSRPNPTHTIGIDVMTPGSSGGGGGGSNGGGGSTGGDDGGGSAGEPDTSPDDGTPGDGDPGPPMQQMWPPAIPPAPGPAPAPAPAVLAAAARQEIPIRIPAPHTSPDGVAQVTGLTTWFWMDPSQWAPATARAELPGIWAEVTATPTRAVWTPGDGSAAITCRGPSRPHPGTSGATTDCGHTYINTGAYTIRVAVTYQVTWTSSTGASGTQPPIVLTTNLPITVEQRQAVTD